MVLINLMYYYNTTPHYSLAHNVRTLYLYTVEPPNNGHIGDGHFVHCSEVVPSSEVEMYGQYIDRG